MMGIIWVNGINVRKLIEAMLVQLQKLVVSGWSVQNIQNNLYVSNSGCWAKFGPQCNYIWPAKPYQ